MKNSKKCFSLSGILTIVFVVLKLCKVITWSWVWVLSPLWISWAAVIVIIGIVGLFATLVKRMKSAELLK